MAWPITGSAQLVRVVRGRDCAVLLSFSAPLDTRWQVRFTSQANATASEITEGIAFPWGPSLGETALSGCP